MCQASFFNSCIKGHIAVSKSKAMLHRPIFMNCVYLKLAPRAKHTNCNECRITEQFRLGGTLKLI